MIAAFHRRALSSAAHLRRSRSSSSSSSKFSFLLLAAQFVSLSSGVIAVAAAVSAHSATTTSSASIADDDTIRNLVRASGRNRRALLSSDEVSRIQPKIIGGDGAPQNRYPYTATLRYSILVDGIPTPVHVCGGALIAPDVILTAAHCLLDANGAILPNFVGARVGVYNLADENEPFEELLAGPTTGPEIAIHPMFNATILDYDYALIGFDTSVTTVEPVRLNRDASIPPPSSTMLTAMGWGVVDPAAAATGTLSDALREITLSYVSNDECAARRGNVTLDDGTVLTNVSNPWLTDNMMCADEAQKDICFGDSGSPLILPGQNAEEDVMVGIATYSFGGCSHPTLSSVFARISSQIDWIAESVCELSSDPPTDFDCGARNTTGGGSSAVPSAVPSTSPTDAEAGEANDSDDYYVTLFLQFDEFPCQTSWGLRVIINDTQTIVANSTSYCDLDPFDSLFEQIPIDGPLDGPNDHYIFDIYDAGGDGMCCTFGEGYYEGYLGPIENDVVLFWGDEFGSAAKHAFTVEAPETETDAPTVAPTAVHNDTATPETDAPTTAAPTETNAPTFTASPTTETDAPTAAPTVHTVTDSSESPSSAFVDSDSPSVGPSLKSSNAPSISPSMDPSAGPSVSPSMEPSDAPSISPSMGPSTVPSTLPSYSPNPSTVPSAPPSKAPTVQIESTIIVSLVGVPNGTIMGENDTRVFERAVFDVLRTDLAGDGIDVTNVTVIQQDLSPAIRVRRILKASNDGAIEMHGASANDVGNPHRGDGGDDKWSHRRSLSSSDVLDVTIIVTGMYNPPPQQNLEELAVEYINAKSDVIVQRLKDSSTTEYFDSVSSLSATSRTLSLTPSSGPSLVPSVGPSHRPSVVPSGVPTIKPTAASPTSGAFCKVCRADLRSLTMIGIVVASTVL